LLRHRDAGGWRVATRPRVSGAGITRSYCVGRATWWTHGRGGHKASNRPACAATTFGSSNRGPRISTSLPQPRVCRAAAPAAAAQNHGFTPHPAPFAGLCHDVVPSPIPNVSVRSVPTLARCKRTTPISSIALFTFASEREAGARRGHWRKIPSWLGSDVLGRAGSLFLAELHTRSNHPAQAQRPAQAFELCDRSLECWPRRPLV
jgi:hypothetical protein